MALRTMCSWRGAGATGAVDSISLPLKIVSYGNVPLGTLAGEAAVEGPRASQEARKCSRHPSPMVLVGPGLMPERELSPFCECGKNLLEPCALSSRK